MTPTPAPDAAVQIALKTLQEADAGVAKTLAARAVVAALARAGWLHDPDEVARFREYRERAIVQLNQQGDLLATRTAERDAALAEVERLRAEAESWRVIAQASRTGAGPSGPAEALCGSWPLGWSEGEAVSCVLPAGHADEYCESSIGGQWIRADERTPASPSA